MFLFWGDLCSVCVCMCVFSFVLFSLFCEILFVFAVIILNASMQWAVGSTQSQTFKVVSTVRLRKVMVCFWAMLDNLPLRMNSHCSH